MSYKRIIPESELILNDDGSIFHLHLKPEQVSDKIIMVGDPARVDLIGAHLSDIECSVTNREFHTITGKYKNKRITVISHGIGGDNIDIVLSELDALKNINFATRTVNMKFEQLSLVRIGTCGGLQPIVPVGSFVASAFSIGYDCVPFFYKNNAKIRNLALEEAFMQHSHWQIPNMRPYAVNNDPELLSRIIKGDIVQGITISGNGFYGPQGRELRLPLPDPGFNKKIEDFKFKDYRITNYEMESAALASLAALMGHKALTVCAVIAGRYHKDMNTNYKNSMIDLIEKVLERI